ncbi:MAG: polyphenol oxidase family protein [Nitrospirae bacterium]|nr:polyphenol oxidase family protein [Nitrospirota bacterium]
MSLSLLKRQQAMANIIISPFPPLAKGGKGRLYCLDLASANKYQAVSAGIHEKNIWVSEECTYCHPDKYYSYRYAKGTTGRQGGFIGIL